MTRLAPRSALAPGWNAQDQRPWPGRLERYRGRELFVRRTPQPQVEAAPSAVFVHGLGGHAANWTDLMALVRGRFACVAPDLPGFGQSPPPDDADYSLNAAVAAVVALVESEAERTGRRVLLAGNSMGGALAVRLAASRPDLVEAMLLVSPALPDFRPRRGVALVPVLALPRVGEGVYRQFQRVPPERQVQTMLDTNFGDPSVVPPRRREEAVAEYQRRMSLPYAGEALSGSARGLLLAFTDAGRTGLWRQAEKVRSPTLLVYGGRDRLVDVRRARRAAHTVRHSRLVVLPEVGHLAQVEAPELVARFLLGFLDALPEQALTTP